MSHFLKWNPIVPGILLAVVAYRSWTRGFPLLGWVAMAVLGIWLIVALANLLSGGKLVRWASSDDEDDEAGTDANER